MRKKHYGTPLGMQIFYLLIRVTGVRGAYLLLAGLIPYYILFRPSVYKSCRPYLSKRFPGDSPVRRWFRTWGYIFHFGQTLIDQAAMGILGPGRFAVDFPENDFLVERGGADRSGFVLMVSHIGAWEASMAFVRRMDKTVHFIMDTGNAQRKNASFFQMDKGFRFEFIDPYGYMGGMLEAVNALEAENIVALMGDRAEQWKSIKVPFLGESASFPVTGPHLAAMTGKDLYILLTARTGRTAFSTRLHNLGDHLTGEEKSLTGKPLVAVYMRIYARLIGEHLEKHPYSWFNFFDFWKVGS
jgi:predicted LPLAT superfamily acyltransferase